MRKEFVMRGQTASGETEVLNFSGYKPGYAYRMTEFQLYPSTNIAGNNDELVGSITAGKTAVAPTDVNFNDEGLIASAISSIRDHLPVVATYSVINDTFLITQNLILMVQDQSGGDPVNWQCRFVAEKMNDSETAVANFRQFTISDE